MPGSSPALLGMSDIETLGVLAIDDKTMGRHLASGDNVDKWQRNWQCGRAVQTEGRKLGKYADSRQDADAQKAVQAEVCTPESSTNKRQDVDTQSQHNADNTTEQSAITNPIITGNNNNENKFPFQAHN